MPVVQKIYTYKETTQDIAKASSPTSDAKNRRRPSTQKNFASKYDLAIENLLLVYGL